jgi:hypothetical protein
MGWHLGIKGLEALVNRNRSDNSLNPASKILQSFRIIFNISIVFQSLRISRTRIQRDDLEIFWKYYFFHILLHTWLCRLDHVIFRWKRDRQWESDYFPRPTNPSLVWDSRDTGFVLKNSTVRNKFKKELGRDSSTPLFDAICSGLCDSRWNCFACTGPKHAKNQRCVVCGWMMIEWETSTWTVLQPLFADLWSWSGVCEDWYFVCCRSHLHNWISFQLHPEFVWVAVGAAVGALVMWVTLSGGHIACSLPLTASSTHYGTPLWLPACGFSFSFLIFYRTPRRLINTAHTTPAQQHTQHHKRPNNPPQPTTTHHNPPQHTTTHHNTPQTHDKPTTNPP